jgi:hypothetical protein
MIMTGGGYRQSGAVKAPIGLSPGVNISGICVQLGPASFAPTMLGQKIPQARELERFCTLEQRASQAACHTFDWDFALLRRFTLWKCIGGSS